MEFPIRLSGRNANVGSPSCTICEPLDLNSLSASENKYLTLNELRILVETQASVPVSVDALAREAVAPGPVGALWARFSLGIINAFFVRAANEAVGDDHGLSTVVF